ncbi:MAG: MFS transporter [Planctomycetota bacterium]|nr:MFS transporter [Planctomycetaceae bacterium]MDQ3329954.1 MFS transporter [Planctomycetota bacterium]
MSGPSAVAVPTETPLPAGDASDRLESRNILLLAGYQVMLRLAWVFKTESVVVPAFLHAISGQAWMQGWLPMLNRFGQSLPPLMYADRLRDMPRKKASLLRTTAAMGIVFVVLAVLLSVASQPTVWWPATFLVLYAAFFVATGLNTLAFNTIQGKLIRPARRGQLMSRGGVIGSAAAIIAAWAVLRHWRAESLSSFILPFAATGIGMLIAAAITAAVAEPADQPRHRSAKHLRLSDHFREAWAVIRLDRHFRRLAFCAMAFVTSQFLFPHYVPLAKESLKADAVHLTLFLIVQNVGVGLFSILLGTLADRFGNRLALRVALITCSLTPLLAVAFANGWLPGGRSLYWVTFFVLGMQPVTFKTFTNYTLELAEPARHPRYLSTLTICLAVPFVFSLLVGWLIGQFGYGPIFLGVSLLIGVAALLTFRMSEPRTWHRVTAVEPAIPE